MGCNEVILVDLDDRALGKMEKMEAHEKGRLHRAFSVFLYDKDEILLQKRASGKYHCGGLWTNSCCSHPHPGEATEKAVIRRLGEELGVHTDNINEEFSFTYYYSFPNGLTEYEFDHVYTAPFNRDRNIAYDTDEVEEILWMKFDNVLRDLEAHPEKYTPWFIICAPRLIRNIRQRDGVV